MSAPTATTLSCVCRGRYDGLAATTRRRVGIARRRTGRGLPRGAPAADRQALETAATRIRRYHERQPTGAFEYTDEFGMRLGQRVTPLRRVGVYVPGGQAAYPSTVLMTVIPARVAGVEEVVVARADPRRASAAPMCLPPCASLA